MNNLLAKSKKLIHIILKQQPRTGTVNTEIRNVRLILNEAINFDKHVIFIAVPKTGTTNVRNQLAQKGKALIPNPHLSIIQVRDTLYAYLLKISLGQNTKYPTAAVPTDAEIRAQAKKVFDSFFKFSSVRNPWARALSLFSRREGVQVKDRLSFEAFCDQHFYASDTCRQPTLHKNQLDWLCDETENCVMDYVYKIEEFDTAIKEIKERTDGRIQLIYGESNANPKSSSKRYREAYSDRTRKIIAERFQKDIDFFKYSF